tara:strand:- start:249 stop:1631 length:1383 start_codon:yes stop_codon:yes gene_type:complete
MFTSIAILGRPNVGKSTLFNKLTKSRKAIVSDFSGLTKDRNYAYINLDGNKALLVDTGGISTDDDNQTEKISSQAWYAAEESSLIIYLADGTQTLTTEDFFIIKKLRKLNKKFITVLNKSDKKSDEIAMNDLAELGVSDVLKISAEHSINIIELKKVISNNLKPIEYKAPEGKKIAVIGRPNAGKSTLINQLIEQDRLIVSEIAGTTIDAISVPFEFNQNEYILIDTAGIRKGYKNNDKIEYFSFIRAMHAVEESDIILFLCDVNEGLVDQDLKIMNLIKDRGKPIILCLSKVDLLNTKQLKKIFETKKMQSEFISNLEIIRISSFKRTGFNKLFKKIDNIIKNSKRKYGTSYLNKLLQSFINKSNPPSIKGRALRLKHAHFGGIYPTTLIINSNHDKQVPQNYKKYLENSFRASMKLSSIQLKLIFKKSENPFQNKKNILTDRQIKKRKRLIKHIKKNN